MKTPWHIWVVGAVALLWNAGGAFDYVMTKIGSEDYLSMLTEPQRAYLEAFPVWVSAAWALGVWGAVAGSLLILLRSRFAVPAFAISVLGIISTSVYGQFLSEPSAIELLGTAQLLFTITIMASLFILLGYARAMTARGHLR